MEHITKQLTIDAPIDTVYAIVADVAKFPEFLPGLESVNVDGDLVTMIGRLGPIRVTLKSRARYTPNKSIDLQLVEGPFKAMNAKWSFEEVAGGTFVTFVANYELSGALGTTPLNRDRR